MITVDYIRGRGVSNNSKTDYVILEQPLKFSDFLFYLLYSTHVLNLCKRL